MPYRGSDFKDAAGSPFTVQADANGNIPVVLQSGQGAVTDRSGTIATGGTAQQLMAANASRKYLFMQNLSTGDLWINFTTSAVQAQPSIKIPAGSGFVMESSFVSTELVSIIGATAGQAFAAKEG